MTDDRQAPYSAEAEQAVLGAMLINQDAALRAAETLDGWMFYREAHRLLFAVMVSIARKSEVVDPITLKTEIERLGVLESVGGVEYLSYLLDVVPTSANFDYHARIVREKATLRRLADMGTKVVQDVFGGRASAAICEQAEASIYAISENRGQGSGFEQLKGLLWPAMERMESLHGRGGGLVTGVATGFKDLDERTAGLQPGELILVAARPSMGKTAFCLNVAQHAAINHGIGVAIFSLEMSKGALVNRMLTSEARVDAHRVRTGTLRDSDYKLMASAAGILSSAPIWIDDAGALTPLELRARARRHASEEKGLGLVIVDYLQLMREPEYSKNRVQEIGAISRSLKALAKELQVPVMALSQLSRAPEQRSGRDHRPQPSDLRDSGDLEQDADTILFLYRPEMYAKPEQRDELAGQAEVIIGKQRNGPTGTVKLSFQAAYTRFDNYSQREDPDQRGQQVDMAPDLPRPARTRADTDE